MCSIAARINLYLLELVGKLVFKSEVASLRIVNLCALLIKYIFVLIHLSGSVNDKTS